MCNVAILSVRRDKTCTCNNVHLGYGQCTLIYKTLISYSQRIVNLKAGCGRG